MIHNSRVRIALVQGYIKEYGGAERVLRVLADIFPEAPIYTAFRVNGSTAAKCFTDRKIIESSLAPILKTGKLYSPLRFLAPLVWGCFDLSRYDLVVVSSSWYITRGFKVGLKTKVIDYCHTPPRWLYGYETSVGLTKYWPVKIYAAIVGHFMRLFDFKTAQGIKYWIANSKNVQARIKKFYRKDSTVIYPPVDVENIIKQTAGIKKEDFYLIVSRQVGAKGIEKAVEMAQKLKIKLKIVGEGDRFSRKNSPDIEFLGRVEDEELYRLYAQAKGFIALARDEDFGLTVVEAQAAGTPVIAFNGGGFRESIIDGVTGILINDTKTSTLASAIKSLNRLKWDKELLQKNAQRFSKERFVTEIKNYVKNITQD